MHERIAEAVLALSRGGIVSIPTESTYGLAVDALSAVALERLFALKSREPGKPPPILISDEAMLKLLVDHVPQKAQELMARFWPGPLTLVLPARADLPKSLAEALVLDGGIGVRRSPHPIADALTQAFGRPITATSANPSGQPAAVRASQVWDYFGDSLYILDGGDAPGAPPSTVARVDDSGQITILRAGALDPARLQE
jgi:L-threonylcarbamoyladenylate synthase